MQSHNPNYEKDYQQCKEDAEAAYEFSTHSGFDPARDRYGKALGYKEWAINDPHPNKKFTILIAACYLDIAKLCAKQGDFKEMILNLIQAWRIQENNNLDKHQDSEERLSLKIISFFRDQHINYLEIIKDKKQLSEIFRMDANIHGRNAKNIYAEVKDDRFKNGYSYELNSEQVAVMQNIKKNLESAISSYTEATNLFQDNAELYFEFASLYAEFRLDDPFSITLSLEFCTQAVIYFTRALQLSPQSEKFRASLESFLQEINSIEKKLHPTVIEQAYQALEPKQIIEGVNSLDNIEEKIKFFDDMLRKGSYLNIVIFKNCTTQESNDFEDSIKKNLVGSYLSLCELPSTNITTKLNHLGAALRNSTEDLRIYKVLGEMLAVIVDQSLTKSEIQSLHNFIGFSNPDLLKMSEALLEAGKIDVLLKLNSNWCLGRNDYLPTNRVNRINLLLKIGQDLYAYGLKQSDDKAQEKYLLSARESFLAVIRFARIHTFEKDKQMVSIAYCNIALTYTYLNDHVHAIINYNHAIVNSPKYAEAYYERACAKERLWKVYQQKMLRNDKTPIVGFNPDMIEPNMMAIDYANALHIGLKNVLDTQIAYGKLRVLFQNPILTSQTIKFAFQFVLKDLLQPWLGDWRDQGVSIDKYNRIKNILSKLDRAEIFKAIQTLFLDDQISLLLLSKKRTTNPLFERMQMSMSLLVKSYNQEEVDNYLVNLLLERAKQNGPILSEDEISDLNFSDVNKAQYYSSLGDIDYNKSLANNKLSIKIQHLSNAIRDYVKVCLIKPNWNGFDKFPNTLLELQKILGQFVQSQNEESHSIVAKSIEGLLLYLNLAKKNPTFAKKISANILAATNTLEADVDKLKKRISFNYSQLTSLVSKGHEKIWEARFTANKKILNKAMKFFDETIALSQYASANDPIINRTLSSAYFGLGEIHSCFSISYMHLEEHSIKEAIKNYEKAIELDSDNADAYFSLANVLEYQWRRLKVTTKKRPNDKDNLKKIMENYAQALKIYNIIGDEKRPVACEKIFQLLIEIKQDYKDFILNQDVLQLVETAQPQDKIDQLRNKHYINVFASQINPTHNNIDIDMVRSNYGHAQSDKAAGHLGMAIVTYLHALEFSYTLETPPIFATDLESLKAFLKGYDIKTIFTAIKFIPDHHLRYQMFNLIYLENVNLCEYSKNNSTCLSENMMFPQVYSANDNQLGLYFSENCSNEELVEIKELIKINLTEYMKSNFKKTLDNLQWIIEIDPNHVEAKCELGRVLLGTLSSKHYGAVSDFLKRHHKFDLYAVIEALSVKEEDSVKNALLNYCLDLDGPLSQCVKQNLSLHMKTLQHSGYNDYMESGSLGVYDLERFDKLDSAENKFKQVIDSWTTLDPFRKEENNESFIPDNQTKTDFLTVSEAHHYLALICYRRNEGNEGGIATRCKDLVGAIKNFDAAKILNKDNHAARQGYAQSRKDLIDLLGTQGKNFKGVNDPAVAKSIADAIVFVLSDYMKAWKKNETVKGQNEYDKEMADRIKNNFLLKIDRTAILHAIQALPPKDQIPLWELCVVNDNPLGAYIEQKPPTGLSGFFSAGPCKPEVGYQAIALASVCTDFAMASLKFAEAINKFESAINAYPNDAVYYIGMAKTQMCFAKAYQDNQKDNQKDNYLDSANQLNSFAILNYTNALKCDPSSMVAFNMLTKLLTKIKEPKFSDKNVEDIKKAIKGANVEESSQLQLMSLDFMVATSGEVNKTGKRTPHRLTIHHDT